MMERIMSMYFHRLSVVYNSTYEPIQVYYSGTMIINQIIDLTLYIIDE